MAKILVKECELCGKRFPTTLPKQRFCCKKCRIEARKLKSELKGQPCWRCENAYCKCSWTRNLIPVYGWDAEKIVVNDKEGKFVTYRINSCPRFIKGGVAL